MNVRLLEPAEQELDEAVAYYNAQVDGVSAGVSATPGHPAYREHCDAEAAAGYRQLALT